MTKTVRSIVHVLVACSADVIKPWLVTSTKQHQNPCSETPTVYQDLSTHHDWPVKNAIVDLSIRLKGNSKHTSNPVPRVSPTRPTE